MRGGRTGKGHDAREGAGGRESNTTHLLRVSDATSDASMASLLSSPVQRAATSSPSTWQQEMLSVL